MNYFNDIILDNEHFIDLPDCISEANDYKETIEKSFAISQGLLTLDSFVGEKNNDEFKFTLVVNGRNENFSVQIISDYVDSENLLAGLNDILKNSGYEGDRHFCDINGGVADFGIAFISPLKENELASQGLIYRQID